MSTLIQLGTGKLAFQRPDGSIVEAVVLINSDGSEIINSNGLLTEIRDKLISKDGNNKMPVSGDWLTNAQFTAASLSVIPKAPTTFNAGSKVKSFTTVAGNNAQVVKNTSGNVGLVYALGLTSNVRWLKFYNKATNPDPAADTPVWVVGVPGNPSGAGVVLPIPAGLDFSTGISVAVVAGIAQNDNTSVAASDCYFNIFYA